ncbi:hypothetical protein PRVXT_001161 [Proteinivorax tanatarense]|uniref:PAS domain-containing protein n=1 Tax=Proteinivorax tanatarense TaxID=1260629 RepID=A0AAU7VPJ0_9FIRM
MKKSINKTTEFVEAIINSIPIAAFVLDERNVVYSLNYAAQELFGSKQRETEFKAFGDAYDCIELDRSEGCGEGPNCDKCIVKKAAIEALRGQHIYRIKGKLVLNSQGRAKTYKVLVSGAPLNYDMQNYAVVVLEDISLIIELEGFLPICATCNKIRGKTGSWHRLENFIEENSEAEFTHDICPDCLNNALKR